MLRFANNGKTDGDRHENKSASKNSLVLMRASRVAAVVGLSVMVGSGWLLTEAYPSTVAFPFAGCAHFAVIGLAGLVVSMRDGRGGRLESWSSGRALKIGVAGLGVFVLPGVISQLVAGAVSSSASVALFCSVPLMMVLGMAWFGEWSETGLMMPSLVGLFGALLLFPVEVPGNMRRVIGLAAVLGCAAVMAGASVWMFKLTRGTGVAASVAVVGIAGAVVLGAVGLCAGWPGTALSAIEVELLRCVVFDLPVVWTTMWLMREVPPVRLAARFLIAPVVTWLEGYATIRGTVEVRSVAALLLMMAGAGLLLIKDESDEVPGLRLR